MNLKKKKRIPNHFKNHYNYSLKKKHQKQKQQKKKCINWTSSR